MKNKLYQKIFLILFLIVGFFALVSDARADYYAEGILQSKNILSNATVTAINSFQVTATVPTNTTVSVKFSQDRVNYYSSAGVKDEWDSCANGTTNIDLSGLTWSGEMLFYKIKLTTTDELVTPVVGQVMVDYDGTAVPAITGITYPPIGHLTSTDLLSGSGITLSGSDYFGYGISYLPYGTGVSAQFSQDGITWYDSTGTMWGWDTLSFGDHSTPATALSLSALNWRGATSFYYKLKIETLADNAVTPIIAEAGLAMFSAVGGNSGTLLGDPILDLSFDEGQGPTAFDSSGNNNHGTLVSGTTGGNTTTTAMWDKGGKKNGAMEFDGSGDGINVNNVVLGSPDSYSISTWLRVSSSVTYGRYLSGAIGGTSHNPELAVSGQGKLLCYHSELNSGSWIDSGYNIRLNEWEHVVYVFSKSGNVKTFVNGKKIYDNNFTATNFENSYNFVLGNTYVYSAEAIVGKMDEFKIYNYALSEDEIKTLYNDGSAMVMGDDESRDNNGTEVTGANKDYCIPGDTAKCDKPVLELKMDEMTGTTAYDTSGNGNNGTLTNGPIWEPNGKIGSALKFERTGNYVGTPLISSLSNSPFTASLWLKPSDFSPNTLIADESHAPFSGNYNRRGFCIGSKYSGQFVFTAGNGTVGSYWDVNNAYVPNVWNHWVFINDNAGNLKLYLNGSLLATKTGFIVTGDIMNLNGLMFGHGDDTLNGLDGFIDDVKIYDYARTPAQIAWDYNQGRPINHWTFDEGTGSTVHDEGPNLNNGTITGATWKNESECKSGKCLYFDGLDQRKVDMDTEDNMKQFTACAWINAKAWTNPGNDAEMSIFNKGWVFNLLNNGKLRLYVSTSASYADIQTATTLEIDEWHRVCTAFGGVGQTSKIFIDGIEQDLSSSWGGNGTQSNDSSAILRIGAAGNEYYGNFYGYIDDPKIYNYALTAEQVKEDYNGGAVNFR